MTALSVVLSPSVLHGVYEQIPNISFRFNTLFRYSGWS